MRLNQHHMLLVLRSSTRDCRRQPYPGMKHLEVLATTHDLKPRVLWLSTSPSVQYIMVQTEKVLDQTWSLSVAAVLSQPWSRSPSRVPSFLYCIHIGDMITETHGMHVWEQRDPQTLCSMSWRHRRETGTRPYSIARIHRLSVGERLFSKTKRADQPAPSHSHLALSLSPFFHSLVRPIEKNLVGDHFLRHQVRNEYGWGKSSRNIPEQCRAMTFELANGFRTVAVAFRDATLLSLYHLECFLSGGGISDRVSG
ncbi:hypothetical protein V8F06_003668 [Rhypophila decipiens]